MDTKFSITRSFSKPVDWVTQWLHTEEGMTIDIQVSIGVKDPSPRAGVLELATLQHVIGVLQGRVSVLQQEAEYRLPEA